MMVIMMVPSVFSVEQVGYSTSVNDPDVLQALLSYGTNSQCTYYATQLLPQYLSCTACKLCSQQLPTVYPVSTVNRYVSICYDSTSDPTLFDYQTNCNPSQCQATYLGSATCVSGHMEQQYQAADCTITTKTVSQTCTTVADNQWHLCRTGTSTPTCVWGTAQGTTGAACTSSQTDLGKYGNALTNCQTAANSYTAPITSCSTAPPQCSGTTPRNCDPATGNYVSGTDCATTGQTCGVVNTVAKCIAKTTCTSGSSGTCTGQTPTNCLNGALQASPACVSPSVCGVTNNFAACAPPKTNSLVCCHSPINDDVKGYTIRDTSCSNGLFGLGAETQKDASTCCASSFKVLASDSAFGFITTTDESKQQLSFDSGVAPDEVIAYCLPTAGNCDATGAAQCASQGKICSTVNIVTNVSGGYNCYTAKEINDWLVLDKCTLFPDAISCRKQNESVPTSTSYDLCLAKDNSNVLTCRASQPGKQSCAGVDVAGATIAGGGIGGVAGCAAGAFIGGGSLGIVTALASAGIAWIPGTVVGAGIGCVIGAIGGIPAGALTAGAGASSLTALGLDKDAITVQSGLSQQDCANAIPSYGFCSNGMTRGFKEGQQFVTRDSNVFMGIVSSTKGGLIPSNACCDGLESKLESDLTTGSVGGSSTIKTYSCQPSWWTKLINGFKDALPDSMKAYALLIAIGIAMVALFIIFGKKQ